MLVKVKVVFLGLEHAVYMFSEQNNIRFFRKTGLSYTFKNVHFTSISK